MALETTATIPTGEAASTDDLARIKERVHQVAQARDAARQTARTLRQEELAARSTLEQAEAKRQEAEAEAAKMEAAEAELQRQAAAVERGEAEAVYREHLRQHQDLFDERDTLIGHLEATLVAAHHLLAAIRLKERAIQASENALERGGASIGRHDRPWQEWPYKTLGAYEMGRYTHLKSETLFQRVVEKMRNEHCWAKE